MPLYSPQEIITMVQDFLSDHAEAIVVLQESSANHASTILNLQDYVKLQTEQIKTLELDLQDMKSAVVIHEHRGCGYCGQEKGCCICP